MTAATAQKNGKLSYEWLAGILLVLVLGGGGFFLRAVYMQISDLAGSVADIKKDVAEVKKDIDWIRSGMDQRWAIIKSNEERSRQNDADIKALERQLRRP